MSIADAIDELERILVGEAERPIDAIIRDDLLPMVRMSDWLREAAAKIEADGTPSQVGPTAGELRSWADLIKPEAGK